MTYLLHLSVLAVGSTTTNGPNAKSGGSSAFSIVFLLAIFAAGYFLIIRPRKARMKAQRNQISTLTIGSEVMSVGGIMGTIVAMTDTTFDVEVADGIVMTFVRRAINARPVEPVVTTPVTTDDELPADPWVADSDGHPASGEHGDSASKDPGGKDPGTEDSGSKDPGSKESGSKESGSKDFDAGDGGGGPARRPGKGDRPGSEGETDTGSGGLGSGGR